MTNLLLNYITLHHFILILSDEELNKSSGWLEFDLTGRQLNDFYLEI